MSSPHPWVILFDIDGTLLTVNRNFNRPLLRGILDDLQIHYPQMESDAFSGRTDHDILTSFLVHHDHSPDLYQAMKSEYLKRMEEQIEARHIIRHPFIDEAIDFFDQMGAHLGLLTGNYPSAARAKLKAAGISYRFSFGAFGEHHTNRNDLPFLAIETVKELYGYEPDPERFLIIGDTPRDVECARNAGMKCVAVTTGKFTRSELMETKPDLVLEDLGNPGKWFARLT